MIHSLPTRDTWAEAAANRLATALADAVAADGRALFAGSGGSTPSPVYARLAQADLDWAQVTATLVDERYVPETSPDSNATLLKRTLLTGPAAAARFIPLYSPAVTVDRAAALASQALAAEGRPLDAVLLGMGEDGHICSMFPGSPTLTTLLTPSLKPAVYGVPAGRDGDAPPQERLTLNLPWLVSARRVVLALTGTKKRAVFEREAASDPTVSPIAALIAANAPLEVFWTEAD